MALDDEHNHQAACLKLIMDRVLPTSGFAEAATGGQARPSVQITISGVGDASVAPEPIEADFTEV